MVRVDFPINLKHWKEPSQIVEKEKCQREDIAIAKNYTVHMSVSKCLHTCTVGATILFQEYELYTCRMHGRREKQKEGKIWRQCSNVIDTCPSLACLYLKKVNRHIFFL